MPIIENPTIDFKTPPTNLIFYLTEGAAIFGCVGDPEGVILANKRSLALSQNGSLYYKTTDGTSTGWSVLSLGGGSGTVGSGIAPRIAFYPANGTTVDDAPGFEYSAAIAPNVSITSQGGLAALRVKESGAVGSLVFNAFPSLLTFQTINAGAFYCIGFTNDTTTKKIAVCLGNTGYLTWDFFDDVTYNGFCNFINEATRIGISVGAGAGGIAVMQASETEADFGSLDDIPVKFVFNNTEQARLTSGNLRLGVPSTLTTSLDFSHSDSANTFRLLAGNGDQQNVTLPVALPTVNQALIAVAVSGNDVTLGYATVGASPAGITGDYQINDADAFGVGVIAQGSNGRIIATPSSIASGSLSFFRVITPTDVLSANVEATGIALGGNGSGATVVRTWPQSSAVTVQREVYIPAPTYNSVAGSNSFGIAATLGIGGAPIGGAGVTLTQAPALHIDSSANGFDGHIQINGTADGAKKIINYYDSTPTKRVELRRDRLTFNDAEVQIYNEATGGAGALHLGAGNNPFYLTIDKDGLIYVNTALGAGGAQLTVTSGSISRPCLALVSANGATGPIYASYNRGANTNSVLSHAVFSGRSTGTTASGFGGQFSFQLELADGTEDSNAVSLQWLWTNAGAGAQVADLVFSNVNGSSTLNETFRVKGNALPEWPYTITPNGTTGNQTIDKPSGTVNIAATGTTVTVTNALVTTSSIVFAVIRTNDATAHIANVVPGSGSFVINLTAAATAEISIGWFVIND